MDGSSWRLEVGPLFILKNGAVNLFGGGLLVIVNGDFRFGLGKSLSQSSSSFEGVEVKNGGSLHSALRSRW